MAQKKRITAQSDSSKAILYRIVNGLGAIFLGIFSIFKKVTFSIIKVVAIVIVAAFVISWLVFVVAGHAATPFIPIISPDPVISGYLGFYSGVISLGIIPLILLIFLLFRLSWGHEVNRRVRRGIFGLWIVTFTAFISTLFFMAKSYSGEYTETEIVVEETWENEMISFEFAPSWREERKNWNPMFQMDNAFIANDRVFIRDVELEILPTESGQIKIVRSVRSAGPGKSAARRNMSYPQHAFDYSGNKISISDYYTLDRRARFRNQRIRYMIHIPVGTEVAFDATSRLLSKNLSYDERKDLNAKKWVVTSKGLEAIQSADEIIDEPSGD